MLVKLKSTLRRTPTVALLPFVNSIPLFGVFFLDWNLYHIMLLFWIESAVVGFFNIFKMIIAGHILSLFFVPFFVFHYGMFMGAHLLFLTAFFAPKGSVEINSFFPEFSTVLELAAPIALAVIFLFISHGVSFIYNFLLKKEYKKTNIGELMSAPYKRIMLMHVTLIFGGWLVMLFHEPILGLALLIVLKSLVDIHAHLNEHKKIHQ